MAEGRDLRFGEFTLRCGQARLERTGEPVALQPKVFDALVLFAERPGELLTKERLLAELWPGVTVGEEALTQLVRKLRLALGDDAREARYLQTVMKRGYRFVAEVEVVELAEAETGSSGQGVLEPAPQPLAESRLTPPPSPAAAQSRPRSRPLLVLCAILTVAAVIALLALRTRPLADEGWSASRLTAQPEREQEGVFSPDGRSYAFEANVDGQFDLFLAGFAGGRRLRLTQTPDDDEYYPQFATDGQTVYFSRAPIAGGAPSIWSIATLGGEERLWIPDASYGAPSPDGRRLAFSRYLRDGRFALAVRELASGAEVELARVDEWLGSVAWSPDGSRIAFATPTAVWTTPAESGAAERAAAGLESVRTVAWSPDGSQLIHDGAWRDGLSRIWSLSLANARRTIVPAPGAAWHPAFSRDGRRMLVTVEHKTRQLWRVGADGSGFEALRLPTTAECFDVDPQSERLAVNDWEAPPRTASLELVELATGATRALGDGLCPAFSGDGNRVAFLRPRGATTDLVIQDLRTGTNRVVAADFGSPGFVETNLDRRPAWSPDGKSLLIEGAEAGSWSLLEVEIESGRRRSLLRGEFGPPAFSPDGRSIVVCGASPLGSGLHLLNAASGAARRIGERCSYRSAPALRADGEAVVFLSGERRRPAIVAVDFDGRLLPQRIRLEPPADPAFWGIFDARPLASGGWIVLSERYEGDLFVLAR